MVGPVLNQQLGVYGGYTNSNYANGNQSGGPFNGGQQPPPIPAAVANNPTLSAQALPPTDPNAKARMDSLVSQANANPVTTNPFGLSGTGKSTGFSSAHFGNLLQQELRPNYSAGLPPGTSNGLLNIMA
jgi:hypothetical protein